MVDYKIISLYNVKRRGGLMSYIMKKYPLSVTIVMLFITLYVISLEWPSHTRRGMSGAQLVPLYLRMEFSGCNRG